ncbi:Nicotinate-nucleotide pyrophosphorylase [carboxylating] [Methyloligella halotolerans]|uniref:Probable nicotinate-nucleotide pyrophosphorylase [carboxylating] n=1 Tax=Methyloligella halotolerans TaxID=1177755 RepID=A0A1E2RYH3_9HYPH|nr:carboxylating nicotinate-nucleotide diphosphorylase [Methyloligella halotolerans]ODA67287.1 Nicotinate-nucleotide pyrophosphorylase [carboxylating] [Methyloligella halotolerans]
MTSPLTLPPPLVAQLVKLALSEDLGQAGDVTTDAIVPESALGNARIVARENGVIAGLELAEAAFKAFDPELHFNPIVEDGEAVAAGDGVADIHGKARAILTGERVALNFLGRLSGIASLTAQFVERVEGTGATIIDTRKTTPGLRALEKFAVLAGGGRNHRFGLFDAVLVKDNHIAEAGGIEPALAAIERHLGEKAGRKLRIEVEVDRLDQLEEALTQPIDAVLLDNMDPETLKEAVRMVRERAPKVQTEASGGVTLETVRGIAETGVDFISVGALTHSPRNLDLSLEWR